ncbi:bifunctional lysylphosphatidylglycerol synthetase/lysine--tRNA ligase LysX [Serinibacter salmoneus]|uniref:Lysine--tRNA ligase n=1 Tax=Serinibacter salmoneus TaxID=556530 RepID=A0A2A9CXW2_9MICO|nr:bifunctional lysylphosphatidylglycerol synthetase/lysine--tRNA ligase LysX [Serinibacter salmoneus]PFG19243.1 lysyl-tRNA synthetase class II [Serinibacter salmoneus]
MTAPTPQPTARPEPTDEPGSFAPAPADSAPRHHHRREREVVVPRTGSWPQQVARWTGRLLMAVAVWQLIALIIRPFARGFVDTVTSWLDVVGLPHPTPFSVVLTALIGSAVLRRQRAALWFIQIVWLLPVVLVVAGSAVLVAAGQAQEVDLTDEPVLFWLSGVGCLVAMAILFTARKAFTARLRAGAWWQAALVFLGGMVLSVVVTFLLLEIVPDSLDTLRDRFNWAVSVAAGTTPDVAPFLAEGSAPHWVRVVAGLISAVGLLLAIVVFLRGASRSAETDRDSELAVRRLLLTYPNDDSLAYFATRDDRHAVFSPNGEAAVSFRVVSDVALAAGDPIGDPQQWEEAINEFIATSRRYGWAPAVVGAGEHGARLYAEHGFSVSTLGDESVIDTRTFSLASPQLGAVRHAIARPRREGYTVKIARAEDIDPEDLADLIREADEWRHGDERGYSMSLSRFGDRRDPRALIVSAYDAHGALRGVLGFVPWARTGISLDVMRRSPEAVNGVTEFMVTSLATQGRGMGIEKISMNFAMLREVFASGEKVGASAWHRLVRRVLLAASRIWQMDSLYKSNQKYDPQWQARYICTIPGQTTHALWAYGQAEGFVPTAPRWLRRRERAASLEQGTGREELATAVLAQEAELRMPAVPPRKLTDQQRARYAKLDLLREAGMDPYPVGVPRTHRVGDVTESMIESGAVVSISGRIVRLRDLGGVIFAVLRERTHEVQVMVTADRPDSRPDLFSRVVDLADTISVTGEVTRSRTGELTVHASSWVMASKALTPPPDKYRGLQDADQRARLRHIDLALNKTPTHLLEGRSVAVWAMRQEFAKREYLEVETPILQAIHGGANARPFTTHINAYDMNLYLRIAPELFLKRLAVGGFERIFEIGRNFRNEGVDYKHNPEFTSLEAYQAYADYTVMRELTRELIIAAARAVHGRPIAIDPNDGSEVNLDVPWPVVTCHEAVSRAVGEEITPDTPIERVRELCEKHEIAFGIDHSHGSLVAELYDELVEDQTTFPTFYTDFPKETSPLTREHRVDPRLAERWDLVAFGSELGTAYSELINPVDQRDRFTRQSLLAAMGDPEAMEIDEEFLSALEFGLPPTGGLGLGVDRVYMFIVGATIRETLTFPFTKPQ